MPIFLQPTLVGSAVGTFSVTAKGIDYCGMARAQWSRHHITF